MFKNKTITEVAKTLPKLWDIGINAVERASSNGFIPKGAIPDGWKISRRTALEGVLATAALGASFAAVGSYKIDLTKSRDEKRRTKSQWDIIQKNLESEIASPSRSADGFEDRMNGVENKTIIKTLFQGYIEKFRSNYRDSIELHELFLEHADAWGVPQSLKSMVQYELVMTNSNLGRFDKSLEIIDELVRLETKSEKVGNYLYSKCNNLWMSLPFPSATENQSVNIKLKELELTIATGRELEPNAPYPRFEIFQKHLDFRRTGDVNHLLSHQALLENAITSGNRHGLPRYSQLFAQCIAGGQLDVGEFVLLEAHKYFSGDKVLSSGTHAFQAFADRIKDEQILDISKNSGVQPIEVVVHLAMIAQLRLRQGDIDSAAEYFDLTIEWLQRMNHHRFLRDIVAIHPKPSESGLVTGYAFGDVDNAAFFPHNVASVELPHKDR